MKLGACVSTMELSQVAFAKEAGFDYVEINISDLYSMHDEVFMEFKNELMRDKIPCEAANCFMPGSLKVVGSTVNYKAISDYLDVILKKGEELGIKTIVFGSGAARSWEDDFSDVEAYRQLIKFICEYAAPKCAQYGMEIAIEPLIYKASKMIHTVANAIKISDYCNLENVRVLADIYHMVNNGDDIDNILKYNGKIIHSHISNPSNRNYPVDKEQMDNYRKFIYNLKAVDCKRCSIEAETHDFEADVKAAFVVMNSLN